MDYDLDPLLNGNLLLATTESRVTVVEELDITTGKPGSTTTFENVEDAHNVDLINGDELALADKGDRRNRVVVFDRSTGELVWEYRFDQHTYEFPRSGSGTYGKGWAHVNVVGRIAPGEFLVSVRNFNRGW